MTKREKLYGWAIVAVLSVPSIINGFSYKYFDVDWNGWLEIDRLRPGFFFFALAVPIVLVLAWLGIQEWLKRKQGLRGTNQDSDTTMTTRSGTSTKKINWKRGFARIAGAISILIFAGVVVWMFADPEYRWIPGDYFKVYELTLVSLDKDSLDEIKPETDSDFDLPSGEYLRRELVETVSISSDDLAALKNRYPEPEYEIERGRVRKIDFWFTAARALLVLIPWGVFLLVWVLILFLKACYRLFARGFKGS